MNRGKAFKEFSYAWLKHASRNRHHWQFWTQVSDKGKILKYEIPDKYIKEMICDWIGSGKAQGHGIPIIQWWDAYNQKIILHSITRRKVERIIEKIRRGEKWNA